MIPPTPLLACRVGGPCRHTGGDRSAEMFDNLPRVAQQVSGRVNHERGGEDEDGDDRS